MNDVLLHSIYFSLQFFNFFSLALLACSSPSSSTMTFVLLGVLLMWT